MRKFFILLTASVICFACKSGSGETNSSETSSDLTVETPANKIAEHVLIDSLYYDLYDNNTAELIQECEKGGSYCYLSGEVIIPSTVQVDSTTYVVTSIGHGAFCSGSLSSVTIPNSVTSIGWSAFAYCRRLTSITIPNSVTSIGYKAFAWSGITEPVYNAHMFAYLPRSYSGHYSIPEGIEQIADGAFADCRGLTSITIPNSVTSIGYKAFTGCGITEPVYTDHVFAYLPRSYSGHYSIPEGIEQIAGGAFADCESLNAITIPNSVTSIGNGAFYGCESLTSVTIPNSVTSIGGWAFDNCESLTSITIPNSVTSIGKGAFEDCESLTSITIPNSVASIGEGAFYGCESLSSATIPNSVTSIGEEAFRDCKSLTSITIPNSVTSIGSYAFYGCESLTSITIPNSVTSIGSYAFYGCESLTSITIPNSVTSIGGWAFNGCSPNLQITYKK